MGWCGDAFGLGRQVVMGVASAGAAMHGYEPSPALELPAPVAEDAAAAPAAQLPDAWLVSPELVLVDPELAVRARAMLDPPGSAVMPRSVGTRIPSSHRLLGVPEPGPAAEHVMSRQLRFGQRVLLTSACVSLAVVGALAGRAVARGSSASTAPAATSVSRSRSLAHAPAPQPLVMASAPNTGGARSRSAAYASAPQPLETIVGPTRVALERASIRFLLMRRLSAVPGSLIDRKTRLVKNNVRSTCRVVPESAAAGCASSDHRARAGRQVPISRQGRARAPRQTRMVGVPQALRRGVNAPRQP